VLDESEAVSGGLGRAEFVLLEVTLLPFVRFVRAVSFDLAVSLRCNEV